MVYFHNRASSNQRLHPAIPIYSRIVYRDSMEMRASEVLQKLKPGFLSTVHHDNMIVAVSSRKYQCRRSMPGSMDKSYFPANSPSSQCLLHQYNRKPSIQNRQSQKDYRLHPS